METTHPMRSQLLVELLLLWLMRDPNVCHPLLLHLLTTPLIGILPLRFSYPLPFHLTILSPVPFLILLSPHLPLFLQRLLMELERVDKGGHLPGVADVGLFKRILQILSGALRATGIHIFLFFFLLLSSPVSLLPCSPPLFLPSSSSTLLSSPLLSPPFSLLDPHSSLVPPPSSLLPPPSSLLPPPSSLLPPLIVFN